MTWKNKEQSCEACCLFYRSVFLYVFIVYLYFYFCAASYGVIKNDSLHFQFCYTLFLFTCICCTQGFTVLSHTCSRILNFIKCIEYGIRHGVCDDDDDDDD